MQTRKRKIFIIFRISYLQTRLVAAGRAATPLLVRKLFGLLVSPLQAQTDRTRADDDPPAVHQKPMGALTWTPRPNSRGCFLAERTCEISRVTLRKMLVQFSFVVLECQICTTLAKVKPAKPSLQMSSAFPGAGAPLRTRKVTA